MLANLSEKNITEFFDRCVILNEKYSIFTSNTELHLYMNPNFFVNNLVLNQNILGLGAFEAETEQKSSKMFFVILERQFVALRLCLLTSKISKIFVEDIDPLIVKGNAVYCKDKTQKNIYILNKERDTLSRFSLNIINQKEKILSKKFKVDNNLENINQMILKETKGEIFMKSPEKTKIYKIMEERTVFEGEYFSNSIKKYFFNFYNKTVEIEIFTDSFILKIEQKKQNPFNLKFPSPKIIFEKFFNLNFCIFNIVCSFIENDENGVIYIFNGDGSIIEIRIPGLKKFYFLPKKFDIKIFYNFLPNLNSNASGEILRSEDVELYRETIKYSGSNTFYKFLSYNKKYNTLILISDRVYFIDFDENLIIKKFSVPLESSEIKSIKIENYKNNFCNYKKCFFLTETNKINLVSFKLLVNVKKFINTKIDNQEKKSNCVFNISKDKLFCNLEGKNFDFTGFNSFVDDEINSNVINQSDSKKIIYSHFSELNNKKDNILRKVLIFSTENFCYLYELFNGIFTKRFVLPFNLNFNIFENFIFLGPKYFIFNTKNGLKLIKSNIYFDFLLLKDNKFIASIEKKICEVDFSGENLNQENCAEETNNIKFSGDSIVLKSYNFFFEEFARCKIENFEIIKNYVILVYSYKDDNIDENEENLHEIKKTDYDDLINSINENEFDSFTVKKNFFVVGFNISDYETKKGAENFLKNFAVFFKIPEFYIPNTMKIINLQDKSSSTKQEREYFVMGCSSFRSEENTSKGIIAVFDVEKKHEIKEENVLNEVEISIEKKQNEGIEVFVMNLLTFYSTNSPITSIAEIRSLLIVGLNCKILIYELNRYDGLNPIAFHDMYVQTRSVSVINNYILASDIQNGVFLFFYRVEPSQIIQLSESEKILFVEGSLINSKRSKQNSFVTSYVDSFSVLSKKGKVTALGYFPENILTRKGSQMLNLLSFNLNCELRKCDKKFYSKNKIFDLNILNLKNSKFYYFLMKLKENLDFIYTDFAENGLSIEYINKNILNYLMINKEFLMSNDDFKDEFMILYSFYKDSFDFD